MTIANLFRLTVPAKENIQQFNFNDTTIWPTQPKTLPKTCYLSVYREHWDMILVAVRMVSTMTLTSWFSIICQQRESLPTSPKRYPQQLRARSHLSD